MSEMNAERFQQITERFDGITGPITVNYHKPAGVFAVTIDCTRERAAFITNAFKDVPDLQAEFLVALQLLRIQQVPCCRGIAGYVGPECALCLFVKKYQGLE